MRSKGVELIALERESQVREHKWYAEHDREHINGELVLAAICYAAPVPVKALLPTTYCDCRSIEECTHVFSTPKWVDPWPWEPEWDKRAKHNRLKRLKIAGALIAAEIDRLYDCIDRGVDPEAGRKDAE